MNGPVLIDWLDEMLNLWHQAHSILNKINIAGKAIPWVKTQKLIVFFGRKWVENRAAIEQLNKEQWNIEQTNSEVRSKN